MDISKALTIDGWMQPAELEWLAEQAASHCVIAEIGSYKGRSTRALLDNTTGLVYAIDDFEGPREIEISKRSFIFDTFLENTQGTRGRLSIIKADHRNLPPIDFQPDMVFIDGAHEYEPVKADIEFWLPRIKPGGLICGHDYWEWFPGVRAAVDECVPGFQVAPNTTIWHRTV